ncbi:hypothetical protein CBR_g10883 [Chara braunii]|uniref:Uncharacterized protein n=1 Tax=Chara braunii TaxID=69332 RepID=A0A388KPH1_CHABU|nr:hypothetical protein CBR_g10883 [Chara braunii]|eukprot:GBG71946.1 hypothetical protein CBR_g10883 [Chara braunii]
MMFRGKRHQSSAAESSFNVDDALDVEEFLDTDEQEALVQSFERQNARQERIWRGCLCSLALGLALFFAHSSYRQSNHPLWETKYHAVFAPVLESERVVMADALGSASFAISGLGLLIGVKKVRWWCFGSALSLALGVGVFWGYYLHKIQEYPWLLLLLPIAAPGFVILCIYVDHMLAETAREIQKLRLFMYRYKKA